MKTQVKQTLCTDKATPRPWKMSPQKDHIKAGIFNVHVTTEMPKKGTPPTNWAIATANKELILCAVNSHEKLLEACKDVLE